MRVKALRNLIYNGSIYSKGTVFDMDSVSVGLAKKYGKIEDLDGGASDEIEDAGETVDGLPPLKKKK